MRSRASHSIRGSSYCGGGEDERVDVGAVAEAAVVEDLVVGVLRREEHDAHAALRPPAR